MSPIRPALCLTAALAILSLLAEPSMAQNRPPKVPFKTKNGPFKANLGTVAEIEVPAGYLFVDQSEMKKFNDFFGNLTGPAELGAVLPESFDWFIIFEYEDIGYVKDDEKNTLDAAAILKELKESNAAGNEERKKRGMKALNLTGWAKAPYYDPQTNNLTWATRLESGGGSNINYQVRLLGRGGVISATMVVGSLEETAPFNQMISGFAFNPGQKYTEWRQGDKMAAVGLTGLIAGGALVAAAKSGILGKLIKPLLIGGAILLGALGSLWRKIFGGKKESADDVASNPFDQNPPKG